MVSVIGDSILDEYIYGSLIQKDFPIFKPLNKHYLLGGAGNVVLNIKEWVAVLLFSLCLVIVKNLIFLNHYW